MDFSYPIIGVILIVVVAAVIGGAELIQHRERAKEE
jgi:hypothetical protein